MSIINVLDSSIFNLISAGEVVERPSSVVKELVENAVDAGAKNIKIEITDGGKTKIRVTDDGRGIEADDLKKAFMPHATSKIKEKNDLLNIETLGFRGEALASIAAVGMITAVSKVFSDNSAHAIEIHGGKIIDEYETSGVTGTVITCDNLFYATPARLKFLKKEKSEETEITSLVQNLILSNPDISFTYTANGKIIYQTQGNGLKNAILCVFNREIAMNLCVIENTYGTYSIDGFISVPTFSRGNRSYQTTILNGRVITNKTIQAAVEKAYEPFLMRRNYPIYVLNINLPDNIFDVNVHPSKFDVRFTDNHSIFSFIYNSVSRALIAYDSIKAAPQIEYAGEIAAESDIACEKSELSAISDNSNKKTENNADYSSFFGNINTKPTAKDDGGSFYRMIKNRISAENAVKSDNISGDENTDTEDIDLKTKPKYAQNSLDEYGEIREDGDSFNFDGKVIGQVFDTYIFVEKGEYLYVIDQHAAHERILYDKLCSSKNIYSQALLIPYIYTANPAEYNFIIELLPDINSIGFDISEFSPLTFKVDAVPEALTGINFDKFFAYITRDFIKPSLNSNDIIKEKLMQTACKSAVKAGDSFTNQQIDILLKSFADAENKPLQCPHGRPTVIKFSRSDFEKWFRRAL